MAQHSRCNMPAFFIELEVDFYEVLFLKMTRCVIFTVCPKNALKADFLPADLLKNSVLKKKLSFFKKKFHALWVVFFCS